MTTAKHQEQTIRENFKNAKLLIIEDNPDHSAIIVKAATDCLPEIKPVLVSDEKQAIAYFNQCKLEEWELPKLILLDLYLPEAETGWRLLDFLKSEESALSKIPVVVLTNSIQKDDITEAYHRGCSSYLVKPVQYVDWLNYFQTLRSYWWETATLPKAEVSIF
jgi:CheY-like chemotaxis protein